MAMAQVSPPLVAVVVLSYNAKSYTLRCIKSVTESKYRSVVTIVVDNGSRDGSPEAIHDSFPEAVLIRSPKNLGFGGGNNLGWRLAVQLDAKYIFFLNDDAFVEPNTINQLVDVLENHPEVVVAAPLTIQEDSNLVLYAGGEFHSILSYSRHAGWLHSPAAYEGREPFPTQFCDFCAGIVRADALEIVNGFDDEFFLYAESIDLSLRLRDLGYMIYVVPGARVFHKGQASADPRFGTDLHLSPDSMYYYVRGFILFTQKRWDRVSRVPRMFSQLFLIIPYYLILKSRNGRRFATLKSGVRGVVDGLKGVTGSAPFSNR
jgi:GT2 family glycosyltransferase